jgi:hypothetical protein
VAQEAEGSSPHSQQLATGPCPEPVESNPSPQNISLRSILIPFSHRRFGLPSGLLLSDFHPKTLYTFHSSPMRATFSAHILRLDLICLMISGDEYKLCNKSHIHFPVFTLYQTIRPVPRLCLVFRNKYRVLWWGLLAQSWRTTHCRMSKTAEDAPCRGDSGPP